MKKKYFEQGSMLYGVVYTMWRGYLTIGSLLSSWFYRRVLGACGQNVHFAHGIYLMNPKRISIGDHCSIGSSVSLISESPEGRLTIHDGVQISDKVHIDFTGNVSIGRGTLISSDVTIYSHDHGYNPRSRPLLSSVTIAEDVWIGYGATLLPGTTNVGQGAIIGAKAVVSKPVEEHTIVAGNPARVLKIRRENIPQPVE